MGTELRLTRERMRLVYRLELWLEKPMLVLAVAWLALLVVELTGGLTPLLDRLGLAIWGLFVLEFLLRLVLAPRKLLYLRQRWLTAVSLLLPALRVFRVVGLLRAARAARGLRGIRLLRVLTAVNRGMKSLGSAMARRGLGYVLTLSVIILFAGAGGMLAFEGQSGHPAAPRDFGAALWWTAMILTTMGSEFWPQTAEGRLLCLFLALYAFAAFGYVTAALASFFIGQDRSAQEDRVA